MVFTRDYSRKSMETTKRQETFCSTRASLRWKSLAMKGRDKAQSRTLCRAQITTRSKPWPSLTSTISSRLPFKKSLSSKRSCQPSSNETSTQGRTSSKMCSQRESLSSNSSRMPSSLSPMRFKFPQTTSRVRGRTQRPERPIKVLGSRIYQT